MDGGQREEHSNKLTMLYALLHIGPCTEDQLVRFNDANPMMNQFQLYVSLGELKEANMVKEEQQLEGKLLQITGEGRNTLEIFGEDIQPDEKQMIDNHAADWKRIIRDELQMPAEWEHKDDGYMVTLRLLEGDMETFHLMLPAVNKQQAVDFCRRWPRQASFLYRTIMEKLGEEQKER